MMIKVGNYFVNETALNDPAVVAAMKSYDLRLQQEAVNRDRIRQGKAALISHSTWNISDRD
jgi:hypothetical protein